MSLIIRLYKTGRRRKIDGTRSSGDFRIGTSVKSWSRKHEFSFIDNLHMVQRRRAAALHGRSIVVDRYVLEFFEPRGVLCQFYDMGTLPFPRQFDRFIESQSDR